MGESPKPLLIEKKKQFKSQTIYFRAEKVTGPVKVGAKQTPKKKQKSKKNPGKARGGGGHGNCELHLSDVKSEWQWSDSRIGLKNVAHLSGLIGRCPNKMCDKLYME